MGKQQSNNNSQQPQQLKLIPLVKAILRKSITRNLSAVLLSASALLFSLQHADAFISTNNATLYWQWQLGNPSGATADTNNHDHYFIQRTVEAIDYSDNFGQPNWASWDLTAGDYGSAPRSSSFYTDTNLPPNFYWVNTDDYTGSGYDRGHMCASEERTDTVADNLLVFFMSNIIPQAPHNNEVTWVSLETVCDSLSQAGNELLIICGPGGFNGSLIQPSQRLLLATYTWKIVVVVPPGSGDATNRINSSTRVIAVKIPNNNSTANSYSNYVTSVRQIEADTGYTFFTALPPDVAAALRDKVDGQSGSLPVITGFSPSSGAVNSSVVITGTGFTSASEVAFQGVSAAFTVNSDTQITATVPTNSVIGPISVTVPSGTAISSDSFTVTGSFVDLAITKTHFGNFSQGDSGDRYTITVSNIGNQASTGMITVTDAIPAGLTAAAISGFGWTTDLGTLTCTRSNTLFAGASYPPITVTVNVATNAATSVTNTATVSGGGDSNPANNTASDVTTINAAVSIANPVTLIGWDMHPLVGGSGIYGVSPLSPTTTGANLTVTAGLTRGSGVGTSGSGASHAWGGMNWLSTTEAAAITANQFATFAVTAQAGYQVSFASVSQFSYRRSAGGPATGNLQYQIGSGVFSNITALSYPTTASTGDTLSPINLTGFPDLQNVGAGTNITFRIVNYSGASGGTWYIYDTAGSTASDLEVQGIVTPIPDLVISKTHAGNFTQGDSGDAYTITVTNIGIGATIGTVTVTDMLPAGLTATDIIGDGWATDLGSLTCTRSESLAPGAGYPPITVIVDVAANAATSLTNTVTVSGGGEINTANDTASDPTTVIASTPLVPDLVISKAHAGNFTQADTGDTYTIIVTNIGTAASSGAVTVTDTLPTGLTATAISGTGWTPNLGTLTCTRSDSLDIGATYPPITITVTVATNAAASLTNTVTVSGGGESYTANDAASDPTTVIALSPIQLWRLQNFGTTNNSGAAADTAISSSDSMPNLLKYALGLNPNVPAANPVVGDISTGYLRLTTPVNPNATDISILVEVATNVTGPWSTSGTTVDINTSTQLRVHYNTPVSSSSKAFIRLHITRP